MDTKDGRFVANISSKFLRGDGTYQTVSSGGGGGSASDSFSTITVAGQIGKNENLVCIINRFDNFNGNDNGYFVDIHLQQVISIFVLILMWYVFIY